MTRRPAGEAVVQDAPRFEWTPRKTEERAPHEHELDGWLALLGRELFHIGLCAGGDVSAALERLEPAFRPRRWSAAYFSVRGGRAALERVVTTEPRSAVAAAARVGDGFDRTQLPRIFDALETGRARWVRPTSPIDAGALLTVGAFAPIFALDQPVGVLSLLGPGMSEGDLATAMLISHYLGIASRLGLGGPAGLATPIARTEHTPLDVIVRSVIVSVRRTFGDPPGGSSFTLDVANPPPIALVDPVLFARVLGNLLVSAAERAKHVAISVSRVAGEVRVRVTDDGPHLDMRRADELFEPVFAATRGRAGLSLVTAQRLMFTAGGRLELEASERGPAFSVWLPEADDPSRSGVRLKPVLADVG